MYKDFLFIENRTANQFKISARGLKESIRLLKTKDITENVFKVFYKNKRGHDIIDCIIVK